MNVGELCNRNVVIAMPELPVTEAARRMRDRHVGDLVIVEQVDGGYEPVGIVTDRDLVLEVMAGDPDWEESLRVGEVMTCELVTAREDEQPLDALQTMRANGVRRIPVVDASGKLEGILTYDDLLEWMVEELGHLSEVVGIQSRREARRTP